MVESATSAAQHDLRPQTTMIRELDWRDLPLLHRVRDRGICPDSQLAFTRGANAFQNALLDVFIPGR